MLKFTTIPRHSLFQKYYCVKKSKGKTKPFVGLPPVPTIDLLLETCLGLISASVFMKLCCHKNDETRNGAVLTGLLQWEGCHFITQNTMDFGLSRLAPVQLSVMVFGISSNCYCCGLIETLASFLPWAASPWVFRGGSKAALAFWKTDGGFKGYVTMALLMLLGDCDVFIYHQQGQSMSSACLSTPLMNLIYPFELRMIWGRNFSLAH